MWKYRRTSNFKPCNSWIFFQIQERVLQTGSWLHSLTIDHPHHIHGRSRAWGKQWHVKNCAQKKTWKAVSTFKKHGVDRGSNVLQAVQDWCSSQWPQPSLPETLFLKCSGDRRSVNGTPLGGRSHRGPPSVRELGRVARCLTTEMSCLAGLKSQRKTSATEPCSHEA